METVLKQLAPELATDGCTELCVGELLAYPPRVLSRLL